jgi:RNA polymerase sigma-70 factor (ECF subfamily)
MSLEESSVSITTETTLEGGGLAVRLMNQDPAALEEIISRYQSKIFHTAYTIVKNHQDAQEITQDTLFTVYRKIGTFRGQSSLCTWIGRITLNNTFMKLRRRRKEPHVPIEEMPCRDGEEFFLPAVVADKGKFADEWTLERELKGKVRYALSELPDKYSQALRLKMLYDYSNVELAQRLNISVAAVKSRLHRARLFLREKMKSCLGSSN